MRQNASRLVKKMATDPEDLYQIALLIDQLKHDDVQIRANASRSLTVIGKQAVGYHLYKEFCGY